MQIEGNLKELENNSLITLAATEDEENIVNSVHQIKEKKAKAIAKRDEAINEVNELNHIIKAYNRQLKQKGELLFNGELNGIRQIMELKKLW